MPRTTLRVIQAVALLTVTATLAACGSASQPDEAPLAQSASDPHPEWSGYTFTIGNNGGDGTQELANSTGVFHDAPYKVDYARFSYGPPLVQAAASGVIDVGWVGNVPPIAAAAEHLGFKIVAAARSLTPEQSQEDLVVHGDSAIQTPADLKGKKIAVPKGSSTHGFVLNVLKSVGLTSTDVELVFLEPAGGASAFTSDKVDAWGAGIGQTNIAVSRGARILAKGLPPLSQTTSYWVASDKSLQDPTRRAALQDVLIRIGKAFAYGSQHLDVYADAIAKEQGTSLSDAEKYVDSYQIRVTAVEQSDIEQEQNLADLFFTEGELTKKVDVSNITDNLLPAGYDSSAQP